MQREFASYLPSFLASKLLDGARPGGGGSGGRSANSAPLAAADFASSYTAPPPVQAMPVSAASDAAPTMAAVPSPLTALPPDA